MNQEKLFPITIYIKKEEYSYGIIELSYLFRRGEIKLDEIPRELRIINPIWSANAIKYACDNNNLQLFLKYLNIMYEDAQAQADPDKRKSILYYWSGAQAITPFKNEPEYIQYKKRTGYDDREFIWQKPQE